MVLRTRRNSDFSEYREKGCKPENPVVGCFLERAFLPQVMKGKSKMTKDEYLQAIMESLISCNDIELIDLIFTLLGKSV